MAIQPIMNTHFGGNIQFGKECTQFDLKAFRPLIRTRSVASFLPLIPQPLEAHADGGLHAAFRDGLAVGELDTFLDEADPCPVACTLMPDAGSCTRRHEGLGLREVDEAQVQRNVRHRSAHFGQGCSCSAS